LNLILSLKGWLNCKSFNSFELKRILISNTSLPSTKIGSWTNRLSRLIENHPGFFDYILSPTEKPSDSFLFCTKKKWIPFFPSRFRNWHILSHVCGQFVNRFLSLNIQQEKVQVLIMDDLVLLEAFARLKAKGFYFELVFSFHGHSFEFGGLWSYQVDKVLFLTHLGYEESVKRNDVFTPIVSIVGNGVDSSRFFPLSKEQKLARKIELGYQPDSKILIWLSNHRPKKGFHLFKELLKRVMPKFQELEIIVIGSDFLISDELPNIRYLGKIPNSELPYFLQIGDFYAFTSLWKEGFGLSLAEAAKCGNRILAANSGGIPEVISDLPGALLIHHPNILEEWEDALEIAWSERNSFSPDKEILDGFQSFENWETRYLKALGS